MLCRIVVSLICYTKDTSNQHHGHPKLYPFLNIKYACNVISFYFHFELYLLEKLSYSFKQIFLKISNFKGYKNVTQWTLDILSLIHI